MAYGIGAALLALAVIVQSPWVMGEHFRPEPGKVALAQAVRQTMPADERVVFMSPGIGLISVLYESQHQGWTVPAREPEEDWSAQISHYRSIGATALALYFDAKTTPAQRQSFQPLIERLPVIAQGQSRGQSRLDGYEYLVLRFMNPVPMPGDGKRSYYPEQFESP